MTLEQFAINAGVKLVSCDKSWGGTIGYQCDDSPNSTVCGFKTEKAAYKHWLQDIFRNKAGKAVIKLLKESEMKRGKYVKIS